MYAKNKESFVESVFVKYDLQRKISYIKRRPVLSAIIGVVISLYIVPIAIYIAFSIAAFVVTFVGFLLILGGVLLAGFLVLSSALATVTIIVIFMGLISWSVCQLYNQANQISQTMQSVNETPPSNHQCKTET